MKFNCILCKGQDYQEISTNTRDSQNRVVKCKNCLHIQLYPLPAEKEEREFYNKDLQTKFLHTKITVDDLEKRSRDDTKRRVELITNNYKKCQLLDVGSGYGFFIRELTAKGFGCIGLEIGKERRRIAKKVTDVPIWSFKINGLNKTGKKFGLITLFHVLEHIKDPIKFSKDLKPFLKKDGALIIEVPNTDHYLLRISRAYRDFYWQISHISYFTPKTVKDVFKKAGYSKLKISGVQRYSFANALNWFFFGKPQLQNPSYQTEMFSILDNFYKNYLAKKLICDTLWIEAKV